MIPDSLHARLAASHSSEEGLHIAAELIKQLRQIEGIRGIHIRPIGGAEDSVNKVVQYAGLLQSSTAAASA